MSADGENGAVKKVSDGEFETEVLKSDIPTLVDFWAEWCGPCRQLAPTIEALAESYDGKLKVMKLNVDENPQTPPQYGIRGIPTVIIFKGGEPVEQLVGNQPKDAIEQAIQKHLS